MTNQQGAPEALRHADGLESFAQMLPAYGFNPQPLKDAASELRRLAALVEAQQPAPSAAASEGEVPLPLLVRDIAADLGTTPIQVCTALAQLGFGGHSVNTAVTPRMAKSLRAHFASTTPQADSQPAPVATNYKQALWSKNCMQCCVSYMLGLPLNSAPDFATDGGWELFSEFVDSKGYAAVMLPGNHEFEADYLASGTTARGTSHMVVMNDGKLVHDPHPSNAGLTEVQCVWLLAKKATPQRDDREAFEACAKAYTSNVSFERDGDDYEDMTASLLWHGWKLRAASAPADSVLEDAARLAKIMQAIRDYHFALDNREHGGVAMARAWNAICDVLNMDWVQGAESAARKQGSA